MKALKNISEKSSGAFPYVYFSLVVLLIFSDHLNPTGTLWSELLMLSIASVFIVQLKYKLRLVDTVLGITTLFWSFWMLLAAYSDAIKIENRTWTMKSYLVVAFLTMNFVCLNKFIDKETTSKPTIEKCFSLNYSCSNPTGLVGLPQIFTIFDTSCHQFTMENNEK